MMKQRSFYHSRLLFLVILLTANFSERFFFAFGNDEICAIEVSMGGEELKIPEAFSSSDGTLDINLCIQYCDFSIVDATNDDQVMFSMTNVRLFDGMLPGKSLYISPGDTLRILYSNKLEYQPDASNEGLNIMGYPDHSNLHFHGAHVSGELPSDDIRMKIEPGDSYQYETYFPLNHMGGTGWVHPHVHGSSALQVGAGAAAAMIIRDDNTDLPPVIAAAPDVVLVIQDFNVDQSNTVIEKSRDGKLEYYRDPSFPNSFRLVNGQYQPYYDIMPYEWVRFRVIYAGWLSDPLNLAFEGCDVELLAKDGVYIRDFPRTISEYLPIPTGGRADVMVRCNTPDTVHQVVDYADQMVLELRVSSASDSERTDLEPISSWTPDYPEYLEDLCEAEITPGCSCSTSMRDCPPDIIVAGGFDREHKCINGEIFHPERYIHSIKFGATVERYLMGNRIHPYHQHVHPFQLCDQYPGMNDQNNEYFQINDWHDVWSSRSGDSATGQQVRFRPNVHYGRLMVHCHVLSHEDEGTMSQEFVSDDAECDCTPVPPRPTRATDQTCFSSIVTANVYNKGLVQMKDLMVGDKVLTSTGEFQTLYSMNHYHPTKEIVFVQIKTDLLLSSGETEPLELSPNHLLFIIEGKNTNIDTTATTTTNKAYPIPASSIKVGNKLQTVAGESTVIDIKTITRNGLYNPLTPDGTIIVNGIAASTYTSPNGCSNMEINEEIHKDSKNESSTNKTDSFVLLSFHDALHIVSSPYRQLCLMVSLDLCNIHEEKSIASMFLESFFDFWHFQQNYHVKYFIYSLCLLCFDIIKTILMIISPNTIINIICKITAIIGFLIYCCYQYFGPRRCSK